MKLAMTLSVEVQLNGSAVVNVNTIQKVATEWAKILLSAESSTCRFEGETYQIKASKPEIFVKPNVNL